MEDPKVYELLSLLLDESISSRKEFREGFQALRAEFTTGFERLAHAQERQTDLLEHFLNSVAAPQSSKIVELERRLEAVERKVA